jgi:hypothetical protein
MLLRTDSCQASVRRQRASIAPARLRKLQVEREHEDSLHAVRVQAALPGAAVANDMEGRS